MRASAEIACRNVSGNAYTLQAIFELAGVFCLRDYPTEERETVVVWQENGLSQVRL